VPDLSSGDQRARRGVRNRSADRLSELYQLEPRRLVSAVEAAAGNTLCLGPWRRGAGHHRSRAVCSFFAWLEQHGIGGLVDIEPFHVAAYIKALKMSDAGDPAVKERAAARPTVKRHLVAIRMLFDWLIVGQILAINPAHAVRGPKHVVKRGKTPVLQVSEQLVRNILGLAQSGNGAIEVPRVPQDDCGDEEVQAQSAVLLVLGRGLERVMSWSLPAHGSGGPLADRGTRRRQAAAPAGWRGHVVILYREPRD
jgi:hypothetical protein